MKKPLVSVVCPVYNKQSTLPQSMQSLFDQSFGDFELIMVDDASEDNSQEIITITKEPRVKRIYLSTNEGVVNAYRTGINKARGKYVMFHDPDDLSLPDRIEKCLNAIGDNDVVYHGLYTVSKHPDFMITSRRYHKAQPWDPKRIYTEQYIPGTIFAKTEILKKVKFPEEAKCAWDWMHHILLHQLGAKYVALDEGLYEYFRFLNNSLSHDNELNGNRQAAIKWIQKYLKDKKLVKKEHKFGKGFNGFIKGKMEQSNLPKGGNL